MIRPDAEGRRAVDAGRGPGRVDALLVTVLLVVGLVGVVAADVPTAGKLLASAQVASLTALGWRRRYPIAATALIFGIGGMVAVTAWAFSVPVPDLPVVAAVLLIPHAVGRWTEGRRLGLGIAMIATSVTLSMAADAVSLPEMLGAAAILTVPLAIGISGRLQADLRLRALERVKLEERDRMGRELDGAIAHRLTAIADRARAGRSGRSPESPLEALVHIEREASAALKEMRGLVHLLRRSDDPR